ncbi:M48 family metalloprotease [Flavobacterium sp. 3HN19-14]|uniref:M48 family metalloprotease n=1 Tax=Flavobacterium sp. 3HN19-14 TaxID=3448133 RepID=UPI003EE36D95
MQQANPNENFSNIKVLLAVSDEVNAYNFGEGIVVIDLPLLLQTDNEYELAFILAHEIAHQQLDHVYGSALKRFQFSNSDEMRDKTRAIARQRFNKGKLASALFKQIVYGNGEESRGKENEADALGYSFFIKAYPKYGAQSIAALHQLKHIDEERDSLVAADYVNLFSKKFQFRPNCYYAKAAPTITRKASSGTSIRFGHIRIVMKGLHHSKRNIRLKKFRFQ